MIEERFVRGLNNSRQIKISVIGRHTGRTITVPVWFVIEHDALYLLPVHGSKTQWYRNLLMNPTITIQVGRDRRVLRANALRGERAVHRVIQQFGDKYKPEIISRLYPGPLSQARSR